MQTEINLISLLAAIEARAQKATPGPWLNAFPHSGVVVEEIIGNEQTYNSILEPGLHIQNHHDLEFVAHCRTDIGCLLAALKKCREQRERYIDGQHHNLGYNSTDDDAELAAILAPLEGEGGE